MRRFPLLLAILFLAGCATVPLTGRRQLALVPQGTLARLNEDVYSQFLDEATLSRDSEQNRLVAEVGGKVAAAAERFMREQGLSEDIKYYNWKFNVVKDDETVDALCMAGGKIAVFTGMLPVSKDEAGLSAVLSHEVAHAVLRHHNERLSQILLARLGESTISSALSKKPQETRELVLGIYGIGAQVGVLLPYSRKQELEADHAGLIIMAMAGYDPAESLNVWRRMAQIQKDQPIEFLSTHPNPETRIENIKRELPAALEYYRNF